MQLGALPVRVVERGTVPIFVFRSRVWGRPRGTWDGAGRLRSEVAR